MSLLVVVITVVCGYKLLNQTEYVSLQTTAQYAVFGAANVALTDAALSDSDAGNKAPAGYFETVTSTATAHKNPLLHYWSLAVEEQFYLIYAPVLLGLTRAFKDRQWIVETGLAITAVASLVAAEVIDPTIAFYNLPTRMWQLLAGCLFSLRGQTLYDAKVPATYRSIISMAGLFLMILLPATVFEFTYPGVKTLPVIIGSLLLIDTPRNTAQYRLLTLADMTTLGNASYTVYLLHWPFIVFGNLLYASNSSIVTAWLSALAACATAVVCYRYWETPLRFARRMGCVVAVALAVAAFATATLLSQSAAHNKNTVFAYTIEPQSQECEPQPQTPSELQMAIQSSLEITRVTNSVLPPTNPSNRVDIPYPNGTVLHIPAYKWWRKHFALNLLSRDLYRNKTGQYRYGVWLLGDSLAMHWFPAVNEVARARNWNLLPIFKADCPLQEMIFAIRNETHTIPPMAFAFEPQECQQYMKNIVAQINSGELFIPDLIITSNAWFSAFDIGGESRYTIDEWRQSFESVLSYFQERGTKRFISIGGVPEWMITSLDPFDPIKCLQEKQDATQCQLPVNEIPTYYGDVLNAELEALKTLNDGTYIDTRSLFCTDCVCPAIVGRHGVMIDNFHLSIGYSRWIGPVLDKLIPPD